MSDQHQAAESGDEVPGRPDRPVRYEDPARNAAYWERIDRIVDAAPPLQNWQRAAIRAAFRQTADTTARTTAVTR